MTELLVQPLEGSIPCEHLVQVYRDRFELAESVATYFASGFAQGEPGIAVATGAHWPVMADRLERRGWSATALEADGRLLVADADATLAAISENGAPSLRRFTEVIGGLLDRAAEQSPTRRVRVFGEMVDLLVRRGDRDAADRLEGMWNRLGARQDFTLLCGYKIDVFDRDSHVALLPKVYRSHSHLLPHADTEQLENAIDAALREILGEADAEKLYAQVAKHLSDERISSAQRTLMWVSAHMPRVAERVLATTRAKYIGAATPAA